MKCVQCNQIKGSKGENEAREEKESADTLWCVSSKIMHDIRWYYMHARYENVAVLWKEKKFSD